MGQTLQKSQDPRKKGGFWRELGGGRKLWPSRGSGHAWSLSPPPFLSCIYENSVTHTENGIDPRLGPRSGMSGMVPTH